ALLKNAPVLLLDEATSSLDSISEARVQSAINQLMTGRTTLIVAHRLSTLRHVDRILILDQGRCVAAGNAEELFASSPMYQRLWWTQERAPRKGMTLDEQLQHVAGGERTAR